MKREKSKDNYKPISPPASVQVDKMPPASVASVPDDQRPVNDYTIFNNKIELYAAECIDANYTGYTRDQLKADRSFFPCLINYLYDNYIGDLLGNRHNDRKVIYPDIDLLDHLFSIYLSLVYKYKFNNRPSILEFSILTGINRDTFYKWMNKDFTDLYNNTSSSIYNNDASISVDNTYNNTSDNTGYKTGDHDGRKHITTRYADTVKKWHDISEQALLDGNGEYIKEIFILKSVYGFRDQPEIKITVENRPIISADELPDLIGIK